MNYEGNNNLQFEDFDNLVSQEDLFQPLDIEEMLKQSRYSAFTPYVPDRAYTLLSTTFQSNTGSFYLKNYDSPATINQERHDRQDYNINRLEGFLCDTGMKKDEVKLARKESFCSDSFDEASDFSLETSQNRSTSVSNQGSPLLADSFHQEQLAGSNAHYVSLKCNKNLFEDLGIGFEFKDLNECVASLLKKSKEELGFGRDIKKRQRKNKDQLKQLEQEYLKNQNWSRDYIKKVAQKLGLRECQVYKWHWDQKKKAPTCSVTNKQ